MLRVGWDNVKIVLIEACPCSNKDELLRHERRWIDELKPSLNINRPIYLENDQALDLKKGRQYYEQRMQIRNASAEERGLLEGGIDRLCVNVEQFMGECVEFSQRGNPIPKYLLDISLKFGEALQSVR
jgi:hypothetical protein